MSNIQKRLEIYCQFHTKYISLIIIHHSLHCFRLMERVFLSPSRYVQGKDIITKAGTYIGKLGNNALLLADKLVWKIAGNDLQM